MSNLGYLSHNKEQFSEYFQHNLANLLLDVHNENNTTEETQKKYLSLANKISKYKLIKILNKYNRDQSDYLFMLLLGLMVLGGNGTKKSVAILQFLGKHTNLSKIHLEKIKASKLNCEKRFL